MKTVFNQEKCIAVLNRILYLLIVWAVFLASILINSAFGQALVYFTNYTGEIEIETKKSKSKKIIQVDSSQTFRLIDDKYDKKWQSESTGFRQVGDNLEYIVWRHAKYGDEKETYIIKQLQGDTLYLQWYRVCTIYGVSKKIPGQTWTLHGWGYLVRDKENIETVEIVRQQNQNKR